MAGDITTLLMWTKNHNHMMYGSSDTGWDRHNILSFLVIHCPFTPQTISKIKILKKWQKKNTWRYNHFTNVYQKWQSYDVWFLRHGVQWTELFVIVSHFFPFYPTESDKSYIINHEVYFSLPKFTGKHLCWRKSLFKKVASLRHRWCTGRLQLTCFPMNFARYFKTSILYNIQLRFVIQNWCSIRSRQNHGKINANGCFWH